jgi:hypothetical protein
MKPSNTTTTLRLNNKAFAVEACKFSKPRKFKVQASAGKIMCTVFWDTEGMLLIDYMPHKVPITGVYYADLLRKNCASQLRRSAKES